MLLFTLIRALDLFGIPIRLTFNNKGSVHKTFLGGFISFFILILMAGYTSLQIKKLVLREADKTNSFEAPVDYK